MQKKYVKSVVGITLFVGKVDLDENYIIYIMNISERNTIVISSTTVLNVMSGLWNHLIELHSGHNLLLIKL